MEKVVYLLGAGFSAPLGLPVMNNFLIKSKDLYFSDTQKYKHFSSVFTTVQGMSVSKNYYEADLFNIEEILSILEMGFNLQGKKITKEFLNYICDVIEFYTPKIELYTKILPGNFWDFVFGSEPIWNYYGFFVSTLHNIKLRRDKEPNICESIKRDAPKVSYSVITLNYDMILENVTEFINSLYVKTSPSLSFVKNIVDSKANPNSPIIAKLHGSSKNGDIVPPTWNKTVERNIQQAWNVAFDKLNEANHLRIIGYSLPTADAYVKYLLKSAVIQAPHLKRIDVICRDDHENNVKKRFDEFINFKYYRFINGDIIDYLKENFNANAKSVKTLHGYQDIPFNCLEEVHEKFMQGTIPKEPGKGVQYVMQL